MQYKTNNIRVQFSVDFSKGKLSLIQTNGIRNRSMFEHNKTLGISYALHMSYALKAGAPFSQWSTLLS